MKQTRATIVKVVGDSQSIRYGFVKLADMQGDARFDIKDVVAGNPAIGRTVECEIVRDARSNRLCAKQMKVI